MKKIVLISCFAALALAQQNGGLHRSDFDATANAIRQEGDVLHFSGNVVIETDGFTLHAGEADFDQSSHVIQARGDVSVRLK